MESPSAKNVQLLGTQLGEQHALQFLGMAVSILPLIKEAGGENCPCLLALGDNTSAMGWTCQSGRLP